MSADLWKYYLQNDLQSFRQRLARAGIGIESGQVYETTAGGNATPKFGSPTVIATSPQPQRRASDGRLKSYASLGKGSASSTQSLTRADVNSRDSFGRTILHHAATSHSDTAIGFVRALLEIPYIDLYVQDSESGWTALHRALYFGNIAVAQALMLRDIRDATDYTTGGVQHHHHAGGLIKIKDHEGNSPFEVFGQTISTRDLRQESLGLPGPDRNSERSDESIAGGDEDDDERKQKRIVRPRIDLDGDELFTFGSNKNLSLGLGDEDDRQYPERPPLERPSHVHCRFHEELLLKKARAGASQDLAQSQQSIKTENELPALIASRPIIIQDVFMSKLHTAVLTNDPVANLFMCGFGPGGRLGTGDETTRFRFVCIENGGLAGRRLVSVALGQDHSIGITEYGEVFTWGSNKFGQLGYVLPKSGSGRDTPIQTSPRQLFGPVKKEVIVGAAASSTHSAIYTSSALYTFGKNKGQLGLMDADARSLDCQDIPRRVGVSLLQSPIQAVSAIDQATTILLENHDVIVLTHYGWTKVIFQLEGFTNYFLQGSFSTRYDPAGNYIVKVTSSGDTICALSSFGEIFAVTVGQAQEAGPSGTSTTNPTKARNALLQPSKIWSIKKTHMAARDVAVGHDGSVILCTESGSVWRKEKRAKVKGPVLKGESVSRQKDYKYVRIPALTRAIAVRSNGFGAFAAIRKDTVVMREQIFVDPQALWVDIFSLLSFIDYSGKTEDSDTENPRPRFWNPTPKNTGPASIKSAVLTSEDPEEDLQLLFRRYEPLGESKFDLWITSNAIDVRIPAHSCILGARSGVLRAALKEFSESYYHVIPEVLSIEYGRDGQVQILFQGADFLTLLNIVFWAYTDNVIDVWHRTRARPHLAARYRQVRSEVMRFASKLEMRSLERAARVMTEPNRTLQLDMEQAYLDQDFYHSADVNVQLADGSEVKVHSAIICSRCAFFDGLFHGRSGGKWLASRKEIADDDFGLVNVDLEHINEDVFNIVLRHLYADTGEEVFEDIVADDMDEFTDLIIDVMSVANELMIDRLAQICQKLLGRYVTTRNVCYLLNAVAPCSVNEFKQVGLEYICLNLEAMLENRLLEDLGEDILLELDTAVRGNQANTTRFARSLENELFERHPQLVEDLERAKQRRIDSMRLRSRLHEDEERQAKLQKSRAGSFEKQSPTSRQTKSRSNLRAPKSPASSPLLVPDDRDIEVPFEMDEDRAASSSSRVPGLEIESPKLASKTTREMGLGVSPVAGASVDTTLSTISPTDSPHLKTPTKESMDFHSKPVITTSGFAVPTRPWGSSLSSTSHTNLKDIMAQASEKRQSNLSLAMKAKNPTERPNFGPKLSQKERKRQQAQKHEGSTPKDTAAIPSPSEPAPKVAAKSPWQTPAKPRALPPGSPEPSSSTTSSSPVPKPMTLRQTVAGTSQPKPTRAVSAPTPNHSSTSPARSQDPPSLTPSSRPTPPAPTIQSIRHIPLPTSSSSPGASASLAYILEQQQSEKAAVREAAASKRSLQEIQTEQEFQEWWDKEERRVREEAEEAERGNGRGKGRKGGRGKERRGRANLSTSKSKPKETETEGEGRGTKSEEMQSSRGRGRGQHTTGRGRVGNRGDGRGRGRAL
ncbi:MAG: hypothetical protein Q9227_002001 [Pyrenula ochraceoflavens]